MNIIPFAAIILIAVFLPCLTRSSIRKKFINEYGEALKKTGCNIQLNLWNPFKEIILKYKNKEIICRPFTKVGGFVLGVKPKESGPFTSPKRLFTDSPLGNYWIYGNLFYIQAKEENLPVSSEKAKALLDDLLEKNQLLETRKY